MEDLKRSFQAGSMVKRFQAEDHSLNLVEPLHLYYCTVLTSCTALLQPELGAWAGRLFRGRDGKLQPARLLSSVLHLKLRCQKSFELESIPSQGSAVVYGWIDPILRFELNQANETRNAKYVSIEKVTMLNSTVEISRTGGGRANFFRSQSHTVEA